MGIRQTIKQTAGAIIGNLILDATLSEVHTKTNIVTSHPVEDGSVISDHIQRQPEKIEITGLVSDSPIVWLASLFASSPIADDLTHPFDRADLAYTEVLDMMDSGNMYDVITPLREYENMVVAGVTVTKDGATGNTVPLAIRLEEVITVETKTVAAPVTDTTPKKPPVDKGRVNPKPAPEKNAEDSASWLGSAASAAGWKR